MTGYGQGVTSGENFQWTVSLRGVNHRFLDLVMRWRDDVPALEPGLRALLETELFRGRVEVNVESASLKEAAVEVHLDTALVEAVQSKVEQLAQDGLLTSQRLELQDVLRMPGALQVQRVEVEPNAADRQALLDAAGRALEQCVEARRLEGEKTQAILQQRLAALRDIVVRCRELRRGATETHLAALRQKLEAWVGEVADEGRLAQEAAQLVDRGDVSEEIDRLTSHLDHLEEVLAQSGSVGKRLDFLAQEILRELNTIASKCRQADITRAVLDGKVLCEQLREQIQNVE